MFTGDSSSTQQQQNKPTKNYQTSTQQWSLNPSEYQNVANDQVDWAALAQQWIQMKETYPPELVAPPPPSFFSKDIRDYEEKGEAPMEVEKDDEHQMSNTTSSSSGTGGGSGVQLLLNGTASAWNSGTNNSTSSNSSPWNTNAFSSSSSQWRWNGWPDSVPNTAVVQATQNDAVSRVPLLPTPTVYSIALPTSSSLSSDPWSSTSKSRFSSSDHRHHHHHHHSSSSRSKEESYKSDNEDHDDDDAMQTLDAAKRKTLPAWIREGLEKMEREKLKQEERERERREREALLLERRKAEEEALKELEKESLIPKKSKFESDSDDEYEAPATKPPYNRMPPVTLGTTAAAAASSNNEHASMGKIKYNDFNQRSKSPEPNYKTRDELVEELMLAVRKNLTEILLEVTNEEILAIALETFTKGKKKAPTAQAMRKTTLTSSLSGGLGLGIYDDSSDSGSDSDEDKDMGNDKNDSDIELQETIKRRKQSFEKISREIEVQIAEQEEREERRREREALKKAMNDDEKIIRMGGEGLNTTGGGLLSNDIIDGKRNFFYDKKDGEPQLHDKNILKYGRSRREKKPSRFSDPRDIVKNVQTHIQIVTSQQKLDSHNKNSEEFDGSKILNSGDKGYRQSHDSNSSSSGGENSNIHHHSKDLAKKSISRNHHKPKYTGAEHNNSDDSVSSASDDIKSHRSSSRRSRSPDPYIRSDRSEESRSSYRRERSRSRSRDYHHGSSKSSSRSDYQRHHHHHSRHHRRRHDSRDRDYDRKRRDRSRSHSYDTKRRHHKTRDDDRSMSKDRGGSKSSDIISTTKSLSRQKY